MKYPKAIRLLKKYLTGKTTPGEEEKVDQWYGPLQQEVPDTAELEQVGEQLFSRIQVSLGEDRKVIPLWQRPLFKVAAAIVVLLCVGGGSFMFLKKHQPVSSPVAQRVLVQDIPAPASSKAVLVLANGENVLLDSITSGGNSGAPLTRIAGSNAAYRQMPGNGTGNETYNTLYNPPGSKAVSLTLADGTQVTLNTGSSFRYPVNMNGTARKVQVEGEAYFEVAADQQRPFIVVNRKSGLEVKVLGTHFNINTYEDEPTANVTLLEGAVLVSREGKSMRMRPGQQVRADGQLQLIDHADIAEVIAWKNGRFLFPEGSDIQAIMRQVSRWYNVKVIYAGNVQQKFGGSISRSSSISQVLKILEATGGIKCKIENNVITVGP
ncbi:FecR family protein [Chitinophaga polysaccharea]|uniref:FecR family protein n=1 Tax=Chitinophaga polysaccharea TaxID=1293035 RepID=A0A561PUD8_9BACT|nr:FecR family protein [Chitinophaga polysaccharea]TWF41735.1 FecR family protein [Chitinophaga polysaccharea]